MKGKKKDRIIAQQAEALSRQAREMVSMRAALENMIKIVHEQKQEIAEQNATIELLALDLKNTCAGGIFARAN